MSQQVIVPSEGGRDLGDTSAGCDYLVARGQRRACDVGAQASSSAGDEPHLLLSHCLILIRVTCIRKLNRVRLSSTRDA
jgi:hypothetical protein